MSLLQIESDVEYDSDKVEEIIPPKKPIGNKILFDKYGLLYRPHRMATLKPNTLSIKLPERPPLGQTQMMYRTGFRRDPIRVRGTVGNIDEIIALDKKMNRRKVQLSDKTLRDLLEVRVPDPKDRNWKSQGRLQRTVAKRVNFGQISKNLNTQLATVNAGLVQNRTESASDRAKMLLQLTSILGSTSKLDKLTEDQFANLGKVVESLNIPKHWWDLLPHRLWSFQQFSRGGETGLIITYLMANSPWTKETPVQVWVKDKDAPKKSRDLDDGSYFVEGIGRLFSLMRQPADGVRKYLDLETRSIIPKWAAEDLVKNLGVDFGKLDGRQIIDLDDIKDDDIVQGEAPESDDDGFGSF